MQSRPTPTLGNNYQHSSNLPITEYNRTKMFQAKLGLEGIVSKKLNSPAAVENLDQDQKPKVPASHSRP